MRVAISLANQKLTLFTDEGQVVSHYPVSTSKLGAGEFNGSGRTPRGLHEVRACIGKGLPKNTILVGRRPTGKVYSPELAMQSPEKDFILS
ncbi:MAG: L,D-transpeptidase, partial [Pseudomonadota bacterium]|nr:L,D-transpeptidase [Pseudomonadota bacterium]